MISPTALRLSREARIRIGALITLLIAGALGPMAAFGAAMAMMNGLAFFALICLLLGLVLISIGLSIWALFQPGWNLLAVSALCLAPVIAIYGCMLA
ncbi:hypothetical protein [Sphingomonas sp. IBVSS2]|uniref:hypothetical protein n=1 Tax=Sphingomonas sp. IBVSS2 TaxID=1985172 RepID=UPI00118197FE|nr:hypothetical protein [Sphingomonas sp. IBVSS2]